MLAEESLDATLEPVEDSDRSPEADLETGGASITWSGDGKYFATVCSSRCGCVAHAIAQQE